MDDDNKLARKIRYLEKTKYLPLIMRVNDNGIIEWWVDTSFAVHEEMRSRSEIYMSLGLGSIYGTLSIQKLNAGSSTEAGFIGVANTMPKII